LLLAPPALADVIGETVVLVRLVGYATAEELREALVAAGAVRYDAGYSASAALPRSGIGACASSIADLPVIGTAQNSFTCTQHPARLAITLCAECDIPLCGQCTRYRLGRAWCRDHAAAPSRPPWLTRLEVVSIGVLFFLLLWALYPLHW
jgi:hypothetical protein